MAIIWLSGAAVLFIVLIAQTTLGRYGDRVADAWAWLLPTVMPSLSVVVGVSVRDGLKTPALGTVDRFVFRLSALLSAGYLLVVCSTIFLSPIAHYFAGLTPLELMTLSHLWLAPLQGLVGGALGVFFTDREKDAA